jgi:uncharacterized protein YbjT (DUF2867 family)
MKIAIAGATGFVGVELIRRLEDDPRITQVFAISRSPKTSEAEKKTIWRLADVADYSSTAKALEGADVAIYLVHSMSPQARMSQGTFEDFDLYQADHFVRAAQSKGVKKIFYLGGIIPTDSQLSTHLKSRLEVEHVLGSGQPQLTSFRAGLILGKNGSSSQMLLTLVKRLPIMITPLWTKTQSEPVDVSDVVQALHMTLFREDLQGQTWDLHGAEIISYRDLMLQVSKSLGLKRITIPIPILSPEISKLWVSLVTGAPRSLVYPLVRSLSHSVLTRPEYRILDQLKIRPLSIDQSVRKIVEQSVIKKSSPRAFRSQRKFLKRSTVRSIQRFAPFTVQQLKNLKPISERYFVWLPRLLLGFIQLIKVEVQDKVRVTFELRFFSIPLLILEYQKIDSPAHFVAESISIVGGALKKSGTAGTLEFRIIPSVNAVLAIVQDFVPRLPWMIYRFTQAKIHAWVMRQFGKELIRIAKKG